MSVLRVRAVVEQLADDGEILNPYYHTENDFHIDASGNAQEYEGRAYIDVDYACENVKGALAWAATEAGLVGARE